MLIAGVDLYYDKLARDGSPAVSLRYLADVQLSVSWFAAERAIAAARSRVDWWAMTSG